MSEVAVQRARETETGLPVFDELTRRMQEVQRRAFEIFADRGFAPGRELDDWFTAEHEVFGWPAAELKEENGSYEIDMTLPGFAAKDVEVTAARGEVIVRAATQRKDEKKEDNVIWSEFGRNEVFRRVSLPQAIDTERVKAELSNGLLKVMAPKLPLKNESAKPVPVTAS